ncbi:hypothetical protein WMY93_009963 [Mugilogobius chulae]|uniref:Uncharacterized protein n=1 Tax=Mugilogobius chulae TaxID=88201 RepID=A0AAW0PEZ6_9GOBI
MDIVMNQLGMYMMDVQNLCEMCQEDPSIYPSKYCEKLTVTEDGLTLDHINLLVKIRNDADFRMLFLFEKRNKFSLMRSHRIMKTCISV